MSVLKRAGLGLREMPSNAAWLVTRVAAGSTDSVGKTAETVTSHARDKGRRLTEAVAPVIPGGGDSIATPEGRTTI